MSIVPCLVQLRWGMLDESCEQHGGEEEERSLCLTPGILAPRTSSPGAAESKRFEAVLGVDRKEPERKWMKMAGLGGVKEVKRWGCGGAAAK